MLTENNKYKNTIIGSLSSLIWPAKNAVKIKPTKYPPVGPKRYATPPPFAKTGNPKDPSIKYKITVRVANLNPKITPSNITTKVCIVAGTKVNGVCILEDIASKAVPINTKIADLIIFELLIMFLVSSIK